MYRFSVSLITKTACYQCIPFCDVTQECGLSGKYEAISGATQLIDSFALLRFQLKFKVRIFLLCVVSHIRFVTIFSPILDNHDRLIPFNSFFNSSCKSLFDILFAKDGGQLEKSHRISILQYLDELTFSRIIIITNKNRIRWIGYVPIQTRGTSTPSRLGNGSGY